MASHNLDQAMVGGVSLDVTTGLRQVGRRPVLEQQSTGGTLNSSHLSATCKTPSKASQSSAAVMTSAYKTPSAKTPKSAGKRKTPSKGVKTPGAGDRFIPSRVGTQMEAAHYKLCTQTTPSAEVWAMLSPSQQQYRQVMCENLNGEALANKIISFNQKPPPAPEGYQNNLKVLYSSSKQCSSQKKKVRYIPQVPERILDAPDILDDYYLSLISWSAQNILAVALGSSVYLWNASTGDITLLMEIDNSSTDYISCLNWTGDGHHLAIGLSSGSVELWHPVEQKKLRTMSGHPARVGSLSWNSHILSSGCRTGAIHHHDVRVAQHQVGAVLGHSQEVCGLQWSPSGNFLASGGNDNLLNIWRCDPGSNLTGSNSLYSFNQHQAAVKALAWCPWQQNVLASGGGTADRHIRFWNCNNGASLSAVDTRSQVCALLWSPEYREIISGHGFTQNQLTIWKYPAMSKVAELTGHTARVLHLCLSPDGSTVVSAGADETLRLWKCFAVDEETKKMKERASQKDDRSALRLHVR
ncbi:hypothetical protein RRG08_015622 [Elysia crispata]|uniref:CDC20/Fizzy WD40 domain-containing protein n=1 Tax=Elysia crispata TaxID=231223 RepID=A0AAE0Y7F9_9GAST|nr:hypothetical protein RRG08_015622 [Elysia crispata]